MSEKEEVMGTHSTEKSQPQSLLGEIENQILNVITTTFEFLIRLCRHVIDSYHHKNISLHNPENLFQKIYRL